MSAEESQNINYYLNQTLEGIPDDLYQLVIDSLILLSEDPHFQIQEGQLSFSEKMDAIRFAYTSLVHYLIENRLGYLNDSQRVFLDTGALADVITFEDEQGKQYHLQLLEPRIYEALRRAILELDDKALPRWSQNIYRLEDQFNAIAMGVLEPVGLDKKNLAKFRALRGLDAQVALSLEQTSILNNTYEALVEQSQALFQELSTLFTSFDVYVKRLPQVHELLEKAQYYNQVISMRDPDEKERQLMNEVIWDPAYKKLGQEIEEYASQVTQLMKAVREKSSLVDVKNQKLKDVTSKLMHVSLEEIGSVRNREDLIFDRETVRLIKTNFNVNSSFAVNEARKSALKIPESTTRILLDAHTRQEADPVHHAYCTVQNIAHALNKILNFHVNLFEQDEAGLPILPPILIEPIRNYVDWADERFILGFVSGEVARQGVKYSFTSVEMAVLRACGMYAFRGKIFDYRGNRLEDNLMADYSARMESSTAVRWMGDELKFKMVTALQEVDAASRTEAVEDYMEFLFHAVNDFPAPLGISTRKLAVMLKYIVVESLTKTIALILRYVADKEVEEAKEAIMAHADHHRGQARFLIEEAVDFYREYLSSSADEYIAKILGGVTE